MNIQFGQRPHTAQRIQPKQAAPNFGSSHRNKKNDHDPNGWDETVRRVLEGERQQRARQSDTDRPKDRVSKTYMSIPEFLWRTRHYKR